MTAEIQSESKKTNEQYLLVKFIEEGKDTVKEDFRVFSLKDQKSKTIMAKMVKGRLLISLVWDMLA